MSEWISYADQQPTAEGIYHWRVPSVAVDGLIVTFYAHMRKRGSGYTDVISPLFDYWDGYRVHVPKGTQWRNANNPPECQWYDYVGLNLEGIELLPCPFCGDIPEWRSSETVVGGGIVCASNPHDQNSWWLECCAWAQTPSYADPRKLAEIRNGMISKTV